VSGSCARAINKASVAEDEVGGLVLWHGWGCWQV
jgi:hypothetical protein